MEIRNAVIDDTMLGYEDHGILSAWLMTKSGSISQGFGGYALDDWNEKKGKRVADVHCGWFIARVLEVVGVSSWEKLKGKYIRVKADYSGIYEIGNAIEDKWFDFKGEWEQHE